MPLSSSCYLTFVVLHREMISRGVVPPPLIKFLVSPSRASANALLETRMVLSQARSVVEPVVPNFLVDLRDVASENDAESVNTTSVNGESFSSSSRVFADTLLERRVVLYEARSAIVPDFLIDLPREFVKNAGRYLLIVSASWTSRLRSHFGRADASLRARECLSRHRSTHQHRTR